MYTMAVTFWSSNARLVCHYFSLLPKPLSRNIYLLGKGSKTVVLDKSQHRIIYNLPYINIIGAILGTKKWIPAVGIAISPLLFYLDDTKISPFIIVITAAAYFGTGILATKIGENIVGKMYVNNKGTVRDVIISSVNSSGKRIDRIHSMNDIINADFSSAIDRSLGFIQLSVQNSDAYYKLNIRHCEFIDKKACDFVLGVHDTFFPKGEKGVDIKKQLQD